MNKNIQCKNNFYNGTCNIAKINYINKNNFSMFFLKIMEHLGVNNIVGITATAIMDIYYSVNNLHLFSFKTPINYYFII